LNISYYFLLLLGSFNWIGEIQAIRSDFEIAVIEMLHILNDLSVLAEIEVGKRVFFTSFVEKKEIQPAQRVSFFEGAKYNRSNGFSGDCCNGFSYFN
jgi:hypothetical protein